jgi:leader peptidase (prepilin peptidase)/N-methyltransferase
MDDFWLFHALPWFWVAMVFILGAGVGSFLNVCAYRLPYEKSVLWPGSRCGSCFQAIRWYDNVPLLSYWLRRGRCRSCGASFSSRYFFVELFTGAAFAGLFYLEVLRNSLQVPYLARQTWDIQHGLLNPLAHPKVWAMFGWHATLLSFLIVAALCDLQHMEIPLSVTATGTVVGLVGSMLLAWPFPNDLADAVKPDPLAQTEQGRQFREEMRRLGQRDPPPVVRNGAYPWPVWYPTPSWMPPGSWQLGLATGLAGALVGMLALRGVRFLFGLGRGIEGLGVGDADLMMMAGSFLGWQPVLLAFFLGVFPALFFGVFQMLRRGGQEMPFGPSLACGVVLSLLFWPALGDHFRWLLFDGFTMGMLAGAGAVFLVVAAFALRLIRGTESEQLTVNGEQGREERREKS